MFFYILGKIKQSYKISFTYDFLLSEKVIPRWIKIIPVAYIRYVLNKAILEYGVYETEGQQCFPPHTKLP